MSFDSKFVRSLSESCDLLCSSSHRQRGPRAEVKDMISTRFTERGSCNLDALLKFDYTVKVIRP